MANFFSYFGGRSTKETTKDAIVSLRQQLGMLEKKEENIWKRIETEEGTARENVLKNKNVAKAALKRKQLLQEELRNLGGTKAHLEGQVNTIENANMNLATIKAMQGGAEALRRVHGDLNAAKVDTIMADIQEQTQLAVEVQEAISNGAFSSNIDEDELLKELEELEQDKLNDMLRSAEPAPIHLPPGVTNTTGAENQEQEEEEMLKKLQAEMAM